MGQFSSPVATHPHTNEVEVPPGIHILLGSLVKDTGIDSRIFTVSFYGYGSHFRIFTVSFYGYGSHFRIFSFFYPEVRELQLRQWFV